MSTVTELREVKVKYCDECNKEITNAKVSYVQDGKDYCESHCPWTFADIIKSHATSMIKSQPFFKLKEQ